MALRKQLHDVGFPGETEKYRRAREDLLQAEMELRRHAEAVAAQRRGLPLGGEVATDYSFEEWTPGETDFKTIRLSELFSPGKDTLFLYNFMFPEDLGPTATPCPSCTSIIDAIDGAAAHIVQRINLVVVAQVPIGQFREHAKARGWRNLQFLSSANNTYKRDYHGQMPDGAQIPVASVFVRRGDKIHHFWSSELFFAPSEPEQHPRHVDFMWPMWSIFDCTPEGRGTDWGPRLVYS